MAFGQRDLDQRTKQNNVSRFRRADAGRADDADDADDADRADRADRADHVAP
jgi:hypothetical protein